MRAPPRERPNRVPPLPPGEQRAELIQRGLLRPNIERPADHVSDWENAAGGGASTTAEDGAIVALTASPTGEVCIAVRRGRAEQTVRIPPRAARRFGQVMVRVADRVATRISEGSSLANDMQRGHR